MKKLRILIDYLYDMEYNVIETDEKGRDYSGYQKRCRRFKKWMK